MSYGFIVRAEGQNVKDIIVKGGVNPPAVVGGAERSSADKPKIRTNKKYIPFS